MNLFVSLQNYLHGDDENLTYSCCTVKSYLCDFTYWKIMDSSNFEYNQRGNALKQTWFEDEKHQAHDIPDYSQQRIKHGTSLYFLIQLLTITLKLIL